MLRPRSKFLKGHESEATHLCLSRKILFRVPKDKRINHGQRLHTFSPKIAYIFVENHIDFWPKSYRFLERLVVSRLQDQMFRREKQ